MSPLKDTKVILLLNFVAGVHSAPWWEKNKNQLPSGLEPGTARLTVHQASPIVVFLMSGHIMCLIYCWHPYLESPSVFWNHTWALLRNALTCLRAILPAWATFYAVTEEGPCLVVNRDSTISLTGHGIVS